MTEKLLFFCRLGVARRRRQRSECSNISQNGILCRREYRRGCYMRIAIMAAGAVGGYFGGRMAAAGHDVAFIARGAHRDAILRDGLRIESPHGDLHLKDLNVADDPKQVGPVDVVLFAVKLWDTEAAGEQARPLLNRNTRVITL